MTVDSFLFPIFVRQGNSKTRAKVGYINREGRLVIDPVYDQGTRFYEGLAAVALRGRWGIIDTNGSFVIEPNLTNWCRFSDGLASLSKKDKWGVIDKTGSFVVPLKYDYLGRFKDGLAFFRAGEGDQARYGFLDRNGVEVILPHYRGARDFSEGLAAVKLGSLWGYIKISGVFQIMPRFDGTGCARRWPDIRAGRFGQGLAPVWTGQDQYRFIDRLGEFVFGDKWFEDANSFAENRAVVMVNNRYGFIDTEGQAATEFRFTSASDFSEGLAMITEGNAKGAARPPSGFINPQGDIVIPAKFYSAEGFRDGLSLVTTDDSIGYINPAGEFVWQGPFVEYGVLI